MTKKSSPLVSIGISFKNNERTLKQIILSVCNQTYSNWELLLVDDNSTDGSVGIVKQFLHFDQLKLYVDSKSKGLPQRLNQLIDLAQGHYFCRMDGDDIMHPERIEKEVAFLEQHKSVDVVGSHAVIISSDSHIMGIRKSKPIAKSKVELIKNGLFIHPTVMGKTSWFKQHRYKNQYVLTEDLELWLRSFNSSQFALLEQPLLFYRNPAKHNHKKYFITIQHTIKIIRQYFPIKHLKTRLWMQLYFWFKYIIATTIHVMQLDRYWLNKRTIGLSPSEYTLYEEALGKALRRPLSLMTNND